MPDGVLDAYVISLGRLSDMITFVAVAEPILVTVRVKVIPSP